MSRLHTLERTASNCSLPASSHSRSGSMTPSSDTSSPASCPPSPSHRHPIFAAHIESSSQDSVLPGSTYPYDDHIGTLDTKHPTGWNSVDTFEIRQGNTRKAVLISPTKFKFKLGRSTSPGSPTQSIRQRTPSLEKGQAEMITAPRVEREREEEAGREIVRERVVLVDRPVSPVPVPTLSEDVEITAPLEESPRLRSDKCARTASGSRFIEVSERNPNLTRIKSLTRLAFLTEYRPRRDSGGDCNLFTSHLPFLHASLGETCRHAAPLRTGQTRETLHQDYLASIFRGWISDRDIVST